MSVRIIASNLGSGFQKQKKETPDVHVGIKKSKSVVGMSLKEYRIISRKDVPERKVAIPRVAFKLLHHHYCRLKTLATSLPNAVLYLSLLHEYEKHDVSPRGSDTFDK